jgi:hypothetical protein
MGSKDNANQEWKTELIMTSCKYQNLHAASTT